VLYLLLAGHWQTSLVLLFELLLLVLIVDQWRRFCFFVALGAGVGIFRRVRRASDDSRSSFRVGLWSETVERDWEVLRLV
jgi:hypothetical protein